MRQIHQTLIGALLLVLALGCKPKPESGKQDDKGKTTHKLKPGTPGPGEAKLAVPGPAVQSADIEWVAVFDVPALVAQFRGLFPLFQRANKLMKSADEMLDKFKEEIGIDPRKASQLVLWFRETGRDVVCFGVARAAVDTSLFVKKSVHQGIEIQTRKKGKGYLVQLERWSVVCDKESSAQLTIDVLKGTQPSLRKSPVWQAFTKLYRTLGHTPHRAFVNFGEGLGRKRPLKPFKGIPMLFAATATTIAIALAPPKGRLDAVLQQSNGLLTMIRTDWNKAAVMLQKKPETLTQLGLKPADLTALSKVINGLQFKLSGDVASLRAGVSLDSLARLLLFATLRSDAPEPSPPMAPTRVAPPTETPKTHVPTPPKKP